MGRTFLSAATRASNTGARRVLRVRNARPIEHGLVIRLLVNDSKAKITEVRLDGHLLKESDTDGYTVRRSPETVVEIASPPAKVRDFHIASCFYDSPTKRRAGFRPEDW